MTKEDLCIGYVVETRDGTKCLFCQDGRFIILEDGTWHTTLDHYRDDLTDKDDETEYDIVKVYEDYTMKRVLWERITFNPKLRLELT